MFRKAVTLVESELHSLYTPALAWVHSFKSLSRLSSACPSSSSFFVVIKSFFASQHLWSALHNCEASIAVDTLNVLWNAIKCFFYRVSKVYKPL